MEDLNRIKVGSVEKKQTGKCLSEQFGINSSPVSKRCTNTSQPDFETLIEKSKLLGVELYELFNKQYIESV